MDIPSSLFAPAQGLENIGKAIHNLGISMLETEERERRRHTTAMRLARVSDHKLKVSQAVDSLLTQAEKDKPELVSTYQPRIAKVFDSFADLIGQEQDPILQSMLTKEHNNLQVTYGTQFNNLAVKQERRYQSSVAFNGFDYSLKAYMGATDRAAEDKALFDATDILQNAEVSGVWSPEIANRQRNLMESMTSKKALLGYEGIIERPENLTQEDMMNFQKGLLADTRLKPEDKKALSIRADTKFRAEIRERKNNRAFSEASKTWLDPQRAMVEVLKPEFGQKYGLTIDQQQNIAQSFSVMAVQQKNTDKERQENNLNKIREVAIKSPAQAIKLLNNADEVDPKDALALKTSIESHLRTQSLMSAQEKALQRQMEDLNKTKITTEIMGGKYRTEQEVMNAVIAAGLPDTNEFLKQSITLFKGAEKDRGAVNYFSLAEQDWDKMISFAKGTKKRELQEQKTKMLTALKNQMEADGLRVSDPRVFDLYKGQKKTLTETWVQQAIGDVTERIGSLFSADPMIPAAPAVAPRPAAPAATMDEATARKRLTGMKITGKAQDEQIRKYKAEGLVR